MDRISFSYLALQASETSRGTAYELIPVAHRPTLTWAFLRYHIEILSFKRHWGRHKQGRAFVFPFLLHNIQTEFRMQTGTDSYGAFVLKELRVINSLA